MNTAIPPYVPSWKAVVATSAPNVLAPKPVYLPERDMIPQMIYERCILNTMTILYPSSSLYYFGLIKTIYRDAPSRFSVMSGLHQNGEGDVLHFSVKVQMEGGGFMALHFNGYFKTFFNVTTITMREKGADSVIADFRKKDADSPTCLIGE